MHSIAHTALCVRVKHSSVPHRRYNRQEMEKLKLELSNQISMAIKFCLNIILLTTRSRKHDKRRPARATYNNLYYTIKYFKSPRVSSLYN